MKFIIALVLASVLVAPAMAAAPGPAPASTGPARTAPAVPANVLEAAQAIEAGKAYVNLIKAHQAEKAIDTCWDFRAVCAGIFETAWDKASDADKARVVEAMQKTVKTIMANPTVADMLAESTFDGWKGISREGRVTVSFVAHFPPAKVAPGRAAEAANDLVLV